MSSTGAETDAWGFPQGAWHATPPAARFQQTTEEKDADRDLKWARMLHPTKGFSGVPTAVLKRRWRKGVPRGWRRAACLPEATLGQLLLIEELLKVKCAVSVQGWRQRAPINRLGRVIGLSLSTVVAVGEVHGLINLAAILAGNRHARTTIVQPGRSRVKSRGSWL